MNALMKPNDMPLTMSSREIADLCGKRHDNVMPVCRSLRDSGVCPEIQETPYVNHQNGQTYTECRMNKRDSLVLIARLSPEFTAKVVDRWQELEAGAAPTLNMRDPRQMAMAALQLIEVNQELQAAIEQQQQKIAEDAPKVDGFERIAKSDGSLCITDAAKTLQVQPRKLTQLLQEKGWVYRRPMGSGWLAYQDRIQSGHLEHKVTTGEKSDGSEWTSTQVRVTARGLAKLAELVRQAELH